MRPFSLSNVSDPDEHAVRKLKDFVAKLTMIGYWRSTEDPEWPEPSHFIDPTHDGEEARAVASYLASGTVYRASAGFSPCRICGKNNGAVEYTDGTFVWPEGLAHYVRDHLVRLPD
jgi:hypothetical protein